MSLFWNRFFNFGPFYCPENIGYTINPCRLCVLCTHWAASLQQADPQTLSVIYTHNAFHHDSGLSPLQRITLCQCVWHHTWLVVIGANYFNGYCCCQPLSTPGTGSLKHFACPSASYHAILYLCITLIIIALFWSFSTQNLQMWKLATIVDFATHFTSSTFVLTTFWEYLIFPT